MVQGTLMTPDGAPVPGARLLESERQVGAVAGTGTGLDETDATGGSNSLWRLPRTG